MPVTLNLKLKYVDIVHCSIKLNVTCLHTKCMYKLRELNLIYFRVLLQEMAALAARMLRVILSDAGSYYTPEKRNAGTVDSLYNLPDLLGVGKRSVITYFNTCTNKHKNTGFFF